MLCFSFMDTHYYRPQTKFAKVMFLHLSVILFTVGVSASVHAGIHTPRQQTPPPREADTPPSRYPPEADTPQSRHPPGKQTPLPLRSACYWNVYLLLLCLFHFTAINSEYSWCTIKSEEERSILSRTDRKHNTKCVCFCFMDHYYCYDVILYRGWRIVLHDTSNIY